LTGTDSRNPSFQGQREYYQRAKVHESTKLHILSMLDPMAESKSNVLGEKIDRRLEEDRFEEQRGKVESK
jgi:hypothetical protein